jgi:hypothetical protein
VLDDLATFRPLGEAGRRLMEEKYSLDATVPPLQVFFERVAGR